MERIFKNTKLIVFYIIFICPLILKGQINSATLSFYKKIINYDSKNFESFKIIDDTLYVYFPFVVKNAPSNFEFKIYSIKPSCTCTGYNLKFIDRHKGIITLKTELQNINRYNYIDAVIKSNAINDYELIKVKFSND